MARNGRKIKADQLAPKIAAGYTDTPMTPEDARREFPVQREPKMSVEHMHGRTMEGSRVPAPTMLLMESDTIIEEPNTGRKFKDVEQVITEEMKNAILAGYMCLKCKEPFPEQAFPLTCDVCGYEVQKRQIIEAAHEFEGTVHIGPAKPLSEFMADLEVRQEQAMFRQKLREGASPMRRAG
jgi:hypothetical protein